MSTSPETRKDHCIKAHKFPHDFRFGVSSRKKSPSTDQMDTNEDVATPSSSKPILMNFHFGHKTQKGFEKRSKKVDPIESMIVDMKSSLPDL